VRVRGQLRREHFPSWKEYYRQYQYELADRFYIPLLFDWGIKLEGEKVLDVGCGDGGFLSAFADRGAHCTGVEIRDFRWKPHQNTQFIVTDISAPEAKRAVGSSHDLIILRDVIEHIPLPGKSAFLSSLSQFAASDGRLFLTFPPYYSPFGLHQQTILKSWLKRLPFLHLLPRRALLALLKLVGETEETRRRIEETIDSKMTIRHFRKLANTLGISILEERFYLVRPSHEIRYGWRSRVLTTRGKSIIDEIRVLGTAFLAGFPSESSRAADWGGRASSRPLRGLHSGKRG
jgi:SAM-dependent methyltransferase